MGNSSNSDKQISESNLLFHDSTIYKIVLKGHRSKIFAVDMVRVKEFNQIQICTVSKDGTILVYTFNDKDIQRYASQRKPKTIKNKKFYTAYIQLRSSYNMTCALTYNHSSQSLFIAHGGLDNMCTIHQRDRGSTSATIYRELQVAQGYTACCQFINDDSNRVIWGSGDYNVYISNYVNDELLLTISVAKYDVTDIDCFVTNDHRLVMGIASVDCHIYIVTIDDSNPSQMIEIHTQKILVAERDVNTIAFSPDYRFVACGGDDGKFSILIRKNEFEYECIVNEMVDGTVAYLSVVTCCWVDRNTVIIGTDENSDVLHVFKLMDMKNDAIYLALLCEHTIEYIGQLILDFCGYNVHRYSMKSAFADNTRVTQLKSLPDYDIAPGIFVASSWENTACLYIPMTRG
eukprot:640516_1